MTPTTTPAFEADALGAVDPADALPAALTPDLLPDDDEELSAPPDQDARVVPDPPDDELDDEAAFALSPEAPR